MTQNIISFPPRSQAHLLRFVKDGQWSSIFELQGTGRYSETFIDGEPLPVAILRIWASENKRLSGGVDALPEEAANYWLLGTPQKIQGIPRIGFLAQFGQWKMAFSLADKEEGAFGGVWSSAMMGYFERGSSCLGHFRAVGGENVQVNNLVTGSIMESEAWQMRSFMARLRQNTFWLSRNSWYSRNDLVEAILGHQNHMVEAFLTMGASFDPILVQGGGEKNKQENHCLLCLCVQSGNSIAFEKILDYGFSPADLTEIFTLCAYFGEEEMFDILVKFSPARKVIENLSVCLAAAISGNQKNMCQKIISCGGDLHFKSDEGYNAIHQAAHSGGMEIIVWLLGQGFSWENKSLDGISAKDILKIKQPKIFDIIFSQSKVVPIGNSRAK